MSATDILADKIICATLKAAVRAGKPRKISVGGGGAVLEALPDGAGRWRLRYWRDGKEGLLGLGITQRCRSRMPAASATISANSWPQARTPASTGRPTRRDETARESTRRWPMPACPDPAHSRMSPECGCPRYISPRGPRHMRRANSRDWRCRSFPGWAADRLPISGRPTAGLSAPSHGAWRRGNSAPGQAGDLLRNIAAYSGRPVTLGALSLSTLLLLRPGELRATEWPWLDVDAPC
jgi:hypothetical protein